ncbi:MAG: serine hydrolase [Planctomycetes bacterium]|nr:serine hydrolase [Planctomycetota bacterium]
MKTRITLLCLLALLSAGAGPLAEKIQPFVDREELAGAVMVVADGEKVIDAETVGWADIAGRKPMAMDAMFWIASQSKGMTAAALMMLVDEGKVSLDDPVGKYIPLFNEQRVMAGTDGDVTKLVKPVRAVTVRDVLSHMSGMGFRSAIEEPTLDVLPLRTRVISYAMTPLMTQPGEKYSYSNEGINTAGRIIEIVSGEPYETFMQKRLFDPLGMTDTTFWPTESQVARIAGSYKPGPGKKGLVAIDIEQLRYPLTDRVNRTPMPAGGLFSTAHDVMRFFQMLVNGGELDGNRVLSAEAVKQLTMRQTPTNVPQSYGLGLAVGPDWFAHGGAYATDAAAKRGLIYIWLVQHAGFPGDGAQAKNVFQQAAEERYKAMESQGR